jgi:hypothetical protein
LQGVRTPNCEKRLLDDDAYIHFDGLLNFLKKRKQESIDVYGERCTGRPQDRDGLAKGGLTAPYCTGGPGYVLWRDKPNILFKLMLKCLLIRYCIRGETFMFHLSFLDER